jgi:2-polyprenyl-6-methoxyphenol hydroxylase-like FAD-dependent oxidoreductase
MRVLISGAGIAGPTLAYWLARYGMTPTIVEKAPALRTGGYVIDFWGSGFDIAERMGLLPQILSSGYIVQEVRVVNDQGRRVAGFPAAAFTRATNNRYVSVPRGDLAGRSSIAWTAWRRFSVTASLASSSTPRTFRCCSTVDRPASSTC